MRYDRTWQESRRLTPETLLKREVRRYLGLKGWFTFPILQGLGAMKGIPDIIACRAGQVLFLECKSVKGRQSEHQKEFQRMIELHGCRYLLIRSVEDLISAGL